MIVFRLGFARVALVCFCTVVSAAVPASASHRHHHRHNSKVPAAPAQVVLDLTPVAVQPYVVPPAAAIAPAQASFLKRMNLENGVEVRSTRWIEPGDVTTRNLFILSVTQSLEGGFDSVNLYDKGVLSWGIMQWTAGTGSLPPVLTYIKRRLIQTGQARVWNKVFVAQGIDANARGLIVYGKPLATSDDMRLAFRGSLIPGNYDPKMADYWATVMARAGRQPAVQEFQREYAQQIVDALLTRSVPGQGATVARLCGGDAYAEALAFALWTNNPRHAEEYLGDAAQAARHQTGQSDPALWGAGTFREALLARCRVSRFSNWQVRAALIAARAQALHTAPLSALTPYERTCQAALSTRKTQIAAKLQMVHQAQVAARAQSAKRRLVQIANRHRALPPRLGKSGLRGTGREPTPLVPRAPPETGG
jgi:hypothetical protein